MVVLRVWRYQVGLGYVVWLAFLDLHMWTEYTFALSIWNHFIVTAWLVIIINRIELQSFTEVFICLIHALHPSLERIHLRLHVIQKCLVVADEFLSSVTLTFTVYFVRDSIWIVENLIELLNCRNWIESRGYSLWIDWCQCLECSLTWECVTVKV